ncbi:hypothetical protein I7I50_12282 [Histoplasma capsulatum G186AR]|uniref:Uncharacterized protein n=1 Tax=Ajellomyces capsulatus TaxID=5037 RepID=A0A8H7YAT4_AJECA|nr:hypothetical protein I7I52_11406 [Histoplasma capsulatum]QSS70595.1 hypothetical protein I7I50_12282 [Histoplasma capsulatum G186AR]
MGDSASEGRFASPGKSFNPKHAFLTMPVSPVLNFAEDINAGTFQASWGSAIRFCECVKSSILRTIELSKQLRLIDFLGQKEDMFSIWP